MTLACSAYTVALHYGCRTVRYPWWGTAPKRYKTSLWYASAACSKFGIFLRQRRCKRGVFPAAKIAPKRKLAGPPLTLRHRDCLFRIQDDVHTHSTAENVTIFEMAFVIRSGSPSQGRRNVD